MVCAFFFTEQSKRNQVIQQIGAVSTEFAEVDHALRAIADRSERLAQTYVDYQAAVDTRLDGATLAEKRKIRESLTVDPDIISALTSLGFRFERARWKIKHLGDKWDELPADLKKTIQMRSRYMTGDDAFLNHKQMVEASRLDKARTKKDMYWAGREISAMFDEILQPSNLFVHEQFRDYLAMQSLELGELLQRYLLATVGILLVLGLGVFIPIDIIIRQMIKRLQAKTREIDAALTKAKLGDKAKSEFLATMSHEIRTPMNGVLGMAELLTRTELDTRQRTFTDVILKSGNALLEIINDILDFSKIDAGQLTLSPKPFNLVDTTEAVATLMSSRVVEKDIELVVRIAPGLPDKLIGDPGRIRQILTNLVGNAVKFTEHGHVMVDINWRKVDPVNDADRLAISIAVQDTGIGIPADKQDAIFEKFSQVDGSSTRKHEGTGLGLAIATRLVEMMGGKIELESEVGVGSTFSFTVEMDVDGQSSSTLDAPSDLLPGRRVLVVDDNAINRMILTEQIRDWGFDCVAVEGGEIGLDLLSSVDQAEQLAALNHLEIFAQLTKPVRTAQLRKTVEAALRQPGIASKNREPAVAPSAPELAPAPSQPAAPAPVTAVAEPQPAPVESKPVIAKRTEPLVLVAEDNAINQIVFQQTLDGLGLIHNLAVNGREAVRLWDELRPTLVLMDVSMPEMNGLEATAAIREIEAREGLVPTPIIAVTAHSLKGDEDRCLAAGMDDYLSKPISPEKLGAMIDRWLPRTTEQAHSA